MAQLSKSGRFQESCTWAAKRDGGHLGGRTDGDYIGSKVFHLVGFDWYFRVYPSWVKWENSAVLMTKLMELPPNVSQITVKRKDEMEGSEDVKYESITTFKEGSMGKGWSSDVCKASNIVSVNQFKFKTTLILISVYDKNGANVTEKYQNEYKRQYDIVVDDDAAGNMSAYDEQIDALQHKVDKISRAVYELQKNEKQKDDNWKRELNEIKALLKKLVDKRKNDNNEDDNDAQEFREWLDRLKLSEYYDLFSQNGVEYIKDASGLNDEHLKEIGIDKIGHRMRILNAFKKDK